MQANRWIVALITSCLPAFTALAADLQAPQYTGTVVPLDAATLVKPAAINGHARLLIRKEVTDLTTGVRRESQELRGTLESYQRGDTIRQTIALTQIGPVGESKPVKSFVFSAEYSLDGKHRESWIHGRSVSELRQKPKGNAAAVIDFLLSSFQLIEPSQLTTNAPLHIRSAIGPIAQVLRSENPKTDFYLDGSAATGRVVGRVSRDGREAYLLNYDGAERLRSSIVSGTMELGGYGIVDAVTGLIVETNLHFQVTIEGHRNGYFSKSLEHVTSSLEF